MSAGRVRWLHEWPSSSQPAFRLGRDGDDLIADWPGFGTLRADPTGARREFTPTGSGSPPHVRERLGEAIAALLRHLQGGITLHASSVAREHAAIACLGESGAGKSTLAAKLCARAGVSLLADDMSALLLEEGPIRVAPTEGHHWLRPDMARAMGMDPGDDPKISLEAQRLGSRPVALAVMVCLAFDDAVAEPTLRRLGGTEAFRALSLSTFRFALDVPEVLQRELDNMARILHEIPLYELRRRREPAAMEFCCPIVQRLLEQICELEAAP